MCTVSWFTSGDGYELFFNRDEMRQRSQAAAPKRSHRGSVEMLAPTDTQAGGTWMCVNSYGVTVALLNRYHDAVSFAAERSRGLLVGDLADSRSPAAAIERLVAEDLGLYSPFTLVLASPLGDVSRLAWNGRELSTPTAATSPLVSSGFEYPAALVARRAAWQELVGESPDRARSLAFHASHVPERGALSACMHRPEAATVSVTRVAVGADSIEMAYAPGPLCCTELAPPVTLERRRSADAA